jgi:hypothetical protein
VHAVTDMRYRLLVVCATAAIAGLLAGCGPASSAASTPSGRSGLGDVPATSAAGATGGAAAGPTAGAPTGGAPAATGEPVVLADGRSPVLITGIDVGGRTMTFDLIEFYTGADAATEYKKDHPGVTELPPLNGHYIRNNNSKLRTLPVATGASIMIGDPGAMTPVTLAALATHIGTPNRPYWITVRLGVINTVEEQFIP